MAEKGEIVYSLEGWFGDVEWREGVYVSEQEAEAEANRLRETRRTPSLPEGHFVQGLCKFAVEEVTLR